MTERSVLIRECEDAAIHMRINVLRLAHLAGSNGAHLGGCLSIIEILSVLYGGIMNIRPGNLEVNTRDRFILSKGNGSLAHYTALEAVKIISEDQLFKFGQNGSILPCVASLNPALGMEYANGTLGLGLSYAVGLALAFQKTKNPYHVYVLLGDGECNEGAVWEAAMSAPHFKLANLTAVVDLNSFQSDGKTCDVMKADLENMWKGFGWEVIRIEDGHNVAQLLDAFTQPNYSTGPRVVIAPTIKGKGVSFMENNNEWHYNCFSRKLFDAAMKEVSEKYSLHDTN